MPQAPHQKRRENGHHVGAIFPLFSLNYFEYLNVTLVDMSLGLSGPVLGFGLMAQDHFFLLSCCRRSLGLMGFGPLSKFLRL